MADIESNLDAVSAALQALVAGWDFTRPGKERSLGRDLAGMVAVGIQERSVPDARGPDGGTWPDNEARYAAWKRKRYSADQPNVRTGQMLSLESLVGGTTVSADAVTMKYGTGRPPDRSATGAALSKADRDITDVEKAFFCSKARPFYGLDEAIADACQKEAQANLDEYLAGGE